MAQARLEQEAAIAGVPPVELEDWTPGELLAAVRAHRVGQQRQQQTWAVIAYQHAGLVTTLLSGKQAPPVYELFPFWEQEEIDQAKLARYKAMLRRMAGGDSR